MRIYFQDGGKEEVHIMYRDTKTTGVVFGTGKIVNFHNSDIVRIEPADTPLVSRRYRDARSGLTIQGPSVWMMLRADIPYHQNMVHWHEGQLVRFHRFPENYGLVPVMYDKTPGVLNPALVVAVLRVNKQLTNPEQYAEGQNRERNQNISHGTIRRIGEQQKVLIHGREWLKVVSEIDLGEWAIRIVDYYFLKERRLYWLSAVTKVQRFDEDWPEFERSITSCLID